MIFSVIIPVWKRPRELKILLMSLDAQARLLEKKIEVVLCDSESGSEVDDVVSDAIVSCRNLIINHIQTENIVAKKRNRGVENSSGAYLIFLDDDCIPADNFLKECLLNVQYMGGEKKVICGEIRFLNKLVGNSNYYRYRDSRHPRFILNTKKELDAWSFVSMNYLISRDLLLKNNLEYGEDFFGYGAEDHDFGYRLHKCGFRILQGGQKIWHYEYGGDIDKYAVKIYHSSRDGMANLKKVNIDLYNQTSKNVKLVERIFLNKSICSNIIYYLLFNYLIYLMVVKFLKLTDNIGVMYFNFLFRYIILRSYVKGIRDRGEINKDTLMKNWYN